MAKQSHTSRSREHRRISPGVGIGCLAIFVIVCGSVYLWWPRLFMFSIPLEDTSVRLEINPPQHVEWILISRLSEYRYNRQGTGYSTSRDVDKGSELTLRAERKDKVPQVQLSLPSLESPGYRREPESTTMTLQDGDLYVVSFSRVSVETIFLWKDGKAVNATSYVTSGTIHQAPGRTRVVITSDGAGDE